MLKECLVAEEYAATCFIVFFQQIFQCRCSFFVGGEREGSPEFRNPLKNIYILIKKEWLCLCLLSNAANPAACRGQTI